MIQITRLLAKTLRTVLKKALGNQVLQRRLLEQATTLRDQLRTTLTSAKELIRTLKAEKRNQKSLQLALASLKQLQAAA